MLDRRTASLLSAVNALCDGGRYEIVQRAELLRLAGLPEEEEGVDKMLSFLAENGYIDIKYRDGKGVYCLYPLSLGRAYEEKTAIKRAEERQSARRFFLFTALSALVGSFAGGGLVFLFAALLGRYAG